MNILILGSSGMLGHNLFRLFSEDSSLNVWGTVRTKKDLPEYISASKFILENVDAFNYPSVENAIQKVCPDVLINCIGIIKQLPTSNDPITSITINSLLPHRIAQTCLAYNVRMIQFSTDCVFSGREGNYTEDSFPDCNDLYGRTKFLGEVCYPHTFTFRTSIIGHELKTSLSLIGWFLKQSGSTKGYDKAIFSGFPTTEIANIIKNYIIPNKQLSGLYNVSADPINKFDLLNLIAKVYKKKIEIIKDSVVSIDRSLNSKRFKDLTGYIPPSWEALIETMYIDYLI